MKAESASQRAKFSLVLLNKRDDPFPKVFRNVLGLVSRFVNPFSFPSSSFLGPFLVLLSFRAILFFALQVRESR